MHKDLSDAIREAREAKGLTQQELADELGFAQQVISRWETGKNTPSGEMLLLLDEVLDTNLSILCSDIERTAVINDEECSGAEAAIINAVKALNPYVDVTSLLSVLRSVKDSLEDETDCLRTAETLRKSMEKTRADILSWCAYHVDDYKENPMITFMNELKASTMDGRVIPDTRIGCMSANEYTFERAYRMEFARVFDGEEKLSRQEVAHRLFYLYGCVPGYIAELEEHVTKSEHDFKESMAQQTIIQSQHSLLERQRKNFSRRIYAGGMISRMDLACYNENGKIVSINHAVDNALYEIFIDFKDMFEQDSRHFRIVDRNLMDFSGRRLYIECDDDNKFVVTDDFYRFLLAQSNWLNIAGGVIEREFVKLCS